MEESVIADSLSTSDMLNKHFTSIGTKISNSVPYTSVLPETFVTPSKSSFQLSAIDPSFVEHMLSTLSVSKASGLDRFSAKIGDMLLLLLVPHYALYLIDLSLVLAYFQIAGKMQRSFQSTKATPKMILIIIDLYLCYLL